MKATKKQIAEVTSQAIAMNFNVESALRTLSNCSLSIYKVIGSKGVVEASATANARITAEKQGFVNYSDVRYLGESGSGKAELLAYDGREVWVAKSNINTTSTGAYTTIPMWCFKK